MARLVEGMSLQVLPRSKAELRWWVTCAMVLSADSVRHDSCRDNRLSRKFLGMRKFELGQIPAGPGLTNLGTGEITAVNLPKRNKHEGECV